MRSGTHQVQLSLDAATINDQLHSISIWAFEQRIAHCVRVQMKPEKRIICVELPDGEIAGAFRSHFQTPLL